MKVTMILERNVTENIEFEIENLDHLKELNEDNEKLWNLISEQDAKTEEVCVEVLSIIYEVDGKYYTEEELIPEEL
jgi:hypothetical protein